ncbi:MAG: histidinol dehydrogenase [Prevotella sp.]|nr:histidinol dehydrogenase [Prevotella sp.]
MDGLTKPLHAYLVTMGYEGVTHEQEHQMEHLFALLPQTDLQTVASYYGLFGEPRLSLAEIAAHRGEQPDETLTAIDRMLRKLAVSPEWQMMRQQ